MSLPKKLESYLEKQNARYDVLKHRVVYTAYDLAATLHVPELGIVKTLLLKTEQGLVLALLSAAHTLDIKKFLKAAKAKRAGILKEKDVVALLKLGKKPLASFGGLYRIPVILEKALMKNKKAVFSGGSFTHSLHMLVKDFIALEKPIIALFGNAKKLPKKKAPPKTTKKKKKQPPAVKRTFVPIRRIRK
ncbi:YbaK/EbsC family protein [Candidatus Uhrbacteria bacterium]|nr:YbaK/EbsC family protein [Candidatus Uhrbacteria bacterium]